MPRRRLERVVAGFLFGDYDCSMPRRPLPEIPRLARKRKAAPQRLFLAVPRLSPEWELSALQALMKPQLKSKIEHRDGLQPWTDVDAQQLRDLTEEVAERIGFAPEIHVSREGDYHAFADFHPRELESAKALAVVWSKHLVDRWVRVGKLLVRDGIFYRRQRGFKLLLKPARDIHVQREIRQALRGMI